MIFPSVQSALVPLLLQIGLHLPAPVGLVNDFAHIIPSADSARIEQIASDVRAKSRGEMTVVTMPDSLLGGRDPSDVALAIGRQWKVGKIGNPGDATRNAGAVILIVVKPGGHGDCRIETGNGAEGFITDADAGAICRAATPEFKAGDWGGATVQVTYATAQRFAGEFNFALDTALRPAMAPVEDMPTRSVSRGIPPQLIFIAIIIIFSLLSNMGRRRRGCGGCMPIFLPFGGGGWGGGGWGGGGGGWSGGGGGGGFGGFGGGGGFSGGGGGSSW